VIGLAEGSEAALITAVAAVMVAVITAVGAMLARQNTKQHNAAALERQNDRVSSMEFREQLNGRLSTIDSRLEQQTGLLVDHISDHVAHPGV
jgi:hypothetical protein